MELLQLRYFHEVAQTQHMTNSAKRLGVGSAGADAGHPPS